MHNMKRVKTAVIGAGYLGTIHARIYSELECAELVGIVDIDRAKGLDVAERYNARYFENIDDVIGLVDVVSITVPTSDHLKVSMPFIKKGKGLLIEKPLAHSIEAAKKIISEAEMHNSLIQVGHLERFNPVINYVRDKIREPMFVEFMRIGPFAGRGTDVDVIMELMIHDLDLINYLIGQDIVSIDAIGIPVLTDKTDIVNARIVFKNGCRANLIASRISTKKERRIRIFQKDGYYNLDMINQEGMFLFRQKNDSGISVSERKLEIIKGEPLKLELKSFLESIKDSRKPAVSGLDGLKALELSDRLNSSLFIPKI